MEVEYDNLPEDVIAFSRYHTKDSVVSVKLYMCILGLIVASGVLVVAVVLAKRLFEGVWLFNPSTVFAITVAAVIVFWMLCRWRSMEWKQAQTAAKEMKLQRLKLRPEGIEHSSPSHAGITVWSAIKKIAVTDEHLFFYISDVTAFCVPKRAFQDEGAFREFVSTAEGFHRQATPGAES